VEAEKLYTTTAMENNSFLKFEVEDHGIGISEDFAAKLFQPFQQTQRYAGGTGLGLYSLGKRIEALNGQYGVTGRKDKSHGSLFWFTIPYKPDSSMDFQIDALSSSNIVNEVEDEVKTSASISKQNKNLPEIYEIGDNPMKSKNGMKVLIVDDSISILKTMKMVMTKEGLKVQQAENGFEALEKIEENIFNNNTLFDVVLMDLQMPIMDGLEAVRRLREKELQFNKNKYRNNFLKRQQLVIGMSASSDNETIQETLDAGFDDFLAKPFTFKQFLDVYKKCKKKLS
jgi:CheY-like chemotaxis protein